MSTQTVAAIGDQVLLQGYGLVGVQVLAADSPTAAVEQWRKLDAGIGLVLLTPAAMRALSETGTIDTAAPGAPLTAVLPE